MNFFRWMKFYFIRRKIDKTAKEAMIKANKVARTMHELGKTEQEIDFYIISYVQSEVRKLGYGYDINMGRVK